MRQLKTIDTSRQRSNKRHSCGQTTWKFAAYMALAVCMLAIVYIMYIYVYMHVHIYIDMCVRKINVTPRGVYLPISKIHSTLFIVNLLAHNNISQICYCSQISLQSAAVFPII